MIKIFISDVDRKIYEHVIIENITTQASLLDETQNPLSGDIIQNVNIQIQNESLKTGAKSSMEKSLTIKTNDAQEAQGDEEEDERVLPRVLQRPLGQDAVDGDDQTRRRLTSHHRLGVSGKGWWGGGFTRTEFLSFETILQLRVDPYHTDFV